MAKDKGYVEALQSFSKSIEILAEAILNQIENNNNKESSNIVDNTSNTSTSDIIAIAEKLEVVAKKVETTSNNTTEILGLVKGIKADKKSSGITKLFDKKKKKTAGIAEGIKDIALMAGAILAVGTAFKIVGDVDFSSVLALAIALPLMAIAFNKVGENVNSPKEAMNISIAMIFMSAGITASGALMSLMPSLTLMQMISVVVVSAAMGISMYLLGNAADELGNKKIKALYTMIPAIPFVAGGIAAAGYALQNMPLIGMDQFLSAIGVGVAMGTSMIPLALAAKTIGTNTSGLFTMAVAMPVIAAGILGSAYILQNIPNVDYMGMFETTGSITASLMIMATGMWAMNKMGVNPAMAISGAIMMPIVAAALMTSSWILSIGNYEDGPSLEWSQGFGLAMIASIPVVMAYGALAATGFGAIVIGAGILSMLAVAGGIVATSEILSGGDYTGGPTKEWAGGVGLALMAFTNAIDTLKPNIFDMLFSSDTMASKIESIITIGGALKDVAAVIKGGDYTGGPSRKWSEGVGIALMTFANALNYIKPNVFERLLGDSMEQNIASIISLGKALPEIGKAVGTDSSMYTGGPSKEWADGVGGSLSAFAGALDKIDTGWFSSNVDERIGGMIKIARALKRIGWAVGSDSSMYTGGPSKEWARGTGDSVTAFATAIVTLADEIDPEDVTEWIHPMKQIAGVMSYFATKLKGQNFDDYPSSSWSKGVLSFMQGVSEFEGGNNIKKTVKNINSLAYANFKLARSIRTIAYSIKRVKKVPDLSKLYSGLLALSVIDGGNLNKVMHAITSKKQKFKSLISIVNRSGDLNATDDLNYYSVPDASSGGGGTSLVGGSTTITNVTTTPASPQVPQEVIIKNDNASEAINQLISINTQLKDVLEEIAVNTSLNNTSPSNITH